MRHFNPKTWHVTTWVAVALWIGFALWANIPRTIDAPSAYAKFSADYTSAIGKPFDPRFVRFNCAVGFPFNYQQHQIMPNLTARLDYNSTVWLLADILLCLTATASVVYVSQSIQRFSVHQLMLGTACVAVAIVLFQRLIPLLVHAIVSMGPNFYFFAYVHIGSYQFLYFLPLPFALYLAYRTRKRQITSGGQLSGGNHCAGGGETLATAR